MTSHSDEKGQTPKTLDPADLGMHLTASGTRVSEVGEDGDVMLMGHHDDRTALGLFAEFRRYNDGETLTEDDLRDYDVERRYATFSNHSEGCELDECECESDEVCVPCRHLDHDACEGQDCLCADDYDHERPKDWPCSCECYCDEYAWWANATTSGHEVTWVRWSWQKSKARRVSSRPEAGDS